MDGLENSNSTVPINEEHMEAMQTNLDKKRYAHIASLSPEEQERFKKMEEAVVVLKGLGVPFILLAAVENNQSRYWRYQSLSNQPVPASQEESSNITKRMFEMMINHAKFFADALHHKVMFVDKAGIPYYIVGPEGYTNLESKLSK